MHVSSDEKEQNPEPSFKGAYEVFSAYYLMIHAQLCSSSFGCFEHNL